jgi:hypothetical protein
MLMPLRCYLLRAHLHRRILNRFVILRCILSQKVP